MSTFTDVSANSHWSRLITLKRSEIEADTRRLSENKARRARELYVDDDDDVAGVLDLSNRELGSFVVPRTLDVLQMRSIVVLILRKNHLRVLEAHTLAPLVHLEDLDVSENDLERLPPVGAVSTDGPERVASFPVSLTSLDASRNHIARLSVGSRGAPNLRTLILKRNHLRFISPDIVKAPQLTTLDLRWNSLNNDPQLKHLASLRRLHTILLTGNPLVNDPRHKLKLFAIAPHLRNALDSSSRCRPLALVASSPRVADPSPMMQRKKNISVDERVSDC